MPDYRELLTELLDLPMTRVTHYQLVGPNRINLFIESMADVALCPDCQQVSTTLHDVSEPSFIRDLPMWNRQCWLKYVARRFTGETCQTTFVERVRWREARLNYTTRYAHHIYQRARREPLAQLAQAERLSEQAVQGIFERGAKNTRPTRPSACESVVLE